VEEIRMKKFIKVIQHHRKNSSSDIIILPRRATQGSAGYDFYLPYNVQINPGETKLIWTDIKVCMENGFYLQMVMRSSYGIKKNLILKNIVGVIDSDYYSNRDNDGNIAVCLYNYGKEIQYLNAEDVVCQGIFTKYYTTEDDNPKAYVRSGGIGSTGN
jgi:dUTP pyrophosphatase